MVRLSLTKKQQETVAGTELLALCQTITDDGQISNNEIVELRNWLHANRVSDLPAIDFLVETVERIIADRKVTREERKELHEALEKVLPPELRKDAKAKRREVEEKLKERERPLLTLDFMVAGVRYEGRAQIITRYAKEADQVFLVRDRKNVHSKNAIEVRLTNGLQIGFVPEDEAVFAAGLLDKGKPHCASVKKILDYHVPIPVIEARIYRPDCGRKDVVFEQDCAPLVDPTAEQRRRSEVQEAALQAEHQRQEKKRQRQEKWQRVRHEGFLAISVFCRKLPSRTDRLFRAIAGEGNDLIYYFLYVLLSAGCLTILISLVIWLLWG